MIRIRSSSRKIDTVFITLLFVVFALTTFLVVLICAKQYKHTAAVISENYESRTATSYLREIIHQHDKAQTVSVSQFESTPALSFHEEIEGTPYTTYVYYYDGYLRELFMSDDAMVDLNSGNPIVEAQGLDLIQAEPDLIQLTYYDTSGQSHEMFVKLHSVTERRGS